LGEVKIDSTGLSSVNSYASLEDLLRSDAHLVIVNTPWELILNMLKKCCWRETRYSRKAFTTTVAEAEELVALATEKELNCRFSK
jgi:predicted dehydrogenase